MFSSQQYKSDRRPKDPPLGENAAKELVMCCWRVKRQEVAGRGLGQGFMYESSFLSPEPGMAVHTLFMMCSGASVCSMMHFC